MWFWQVLGNVLFTEKLYPVVSLRRSIYPHGSENIIFTLVFLWKMREL